MEQSPSEILREEHGGTVSFLLTGTFDARAAVRLRHMLEGVDGACVVVDFSRVRQFVDVAVAVLSGGLKSRSVELRGLGRHQESVFRYFDIKVGRDPDRPYYQPEEILAL
ncbi:MAG TPA: STAS domain-containing protein [Myxococcales bacterium]|nr:STAS domain-containing protein [Myxococcales bacterium]